MNDIELAKALGWFSIGIGAIEILAPKQLRTELGVHRSSAFVRAFGAREIAAGAAILTYPEEPGPVWARVAGDALDLLVLAGAVTSRRNRDRAAPTVASLAVLGVTALDLLCAIALTKRNTAFRRTAERARIARA
jgi:hypothetical protein